MSLPLFTIASQSPVVLTLLGDSPTRLWPWGRAPQSPAYPYAVFQVVGGSPENYLSDRPDVDAVSVQVDVYARDANAAEEVALALRDAIELDCNITSWRGGDRDPVTHNYHAGFDCLWMVSR